MNKRQLKILSKALNPKIANTLNRLEKDFDNYFLKNKKFKSSEYKIMKKIIQDTILQNLPRLVKEGMEKSLDQIRNNQNPKHKNFLFNPIVTSND